MSAWNRSPVCWDQNNLYSACTVLVSESGRKNFLFLYLFGQSLGKNNYQRNSKNVHIVAVWIVVRHPAGAIVKCVESYQCFHQDTNIRNLKRGHTHLHVLLLICAFYLVFQQGTITKIEDAKRHVYELDDKMRYNIQIIIIQNGCYFVKLKVSGIIAWDVHLFVLKIHVKRKASLFCKF